jgi:MFS transporter, DHA1 family, multidrug resistance protein
MDAPAKPVSQQGVLAIPRSEFIALMAALMAMNSLAIDVMLPALQQIGASLGVADDNVRQLVITSYLIGFGVFQLAFGPVSDRFGRRGPLLVGTAIYLLSALAAVFAPTFGILLALRFTQGVGAAATRVISQSVVRDTFGGRRMAEVMSLIMMVFMILPVIAPATGQLIMLLGDWQMIFIFMAGLGTVITLWAVFRLPETLAPANRRPLTFTAVAQGFRLVLTNRTALCYSLATALLFGGLFGFVNSAQQIYEQTYGLGNLFPLAFALVAIFMAASSYLNARLVGRFGMRRLSHMALLGFIAASLVWLVLSLAGAIPFAVFMVVFAIAMFQFGSIGANFNALAMEPLGNVAGTASAVLGAVQTVVGGLIGAVIGQAYDGTVTPLGAGYFVLSLMALGVVLIAERGRLFQARNELVV